MIQSTSEQVQELENELKRVSDPGQKLEKGIAFMEASLNPSALSFKNFWEARKLLSEYFRENLVPTHRTLLWTKFCELTQEARRLKSELEEEKAFEVEQLEAAIAAVEADVSAAQPQTKKTQLMQELSSSIALEENASRYVDMLHTLEILDNQATRISSLRQELAKMPIRYQTKKRLFERLSKTGDAVFPKRRDLVQRVREQFIQDIDQLIANHFSTSPTSIPIENLRDEIKFLQSFTKSLILSGKAFTEVRTKLSRCWDALQKADKERREQRDQQFAQYKEQADKLSAKIKEIAEKIASGDLKLDQAEKELEVISKEMKTTELGRREVTILKRELRQARSPLDSKLEAEQKERAQRVEKKERERSDQITAFETLLEEHLSSKTPYDYGDLSRTFAELPANAQEKEHLSALLKKLEHQEMLKKEEELLSELPKDKQKQIDQLYEVLELRRVRYNSAKEQHDQLRKAGGESGLDFAESMRYQELILLSKEKLEEQELALEELEQKILALEH